MQNFYIFLEVTLPAYFSILANTLKSKIKNLVNISESSHQYEIEEQFQDTALIYTGSIQAEQNPFLLTAIPLEAFKIFSISFHDLDIIHNEVVFRIWVDGNFPNEFFRPQH